MEPNTPQVQADNSTMTDDDLSAALGYITTHAQNLHMQSQPDETTAQDEASSPEAQNKTSGAQPMSKDDNQDREIQAIRDELEALKHDDETTQSTGTTE